MHALVRILFLVTTTVALAACGTAKNAQLGEGCGPSQGCDQGLTCQSGLCVAINASGGGGGGGSVIAVHNGGGGGGSSGGAGGGGAAGGSAGGGAGGGTACGPCNTPPDACHALQGRCVNSVCVYDFVTGAACDDGNACTVADTCQNGGCFGTAKVCNQAPSNVCLSSTQLQSYDATGACNGGLCVYNSQTVACGAGGCSSGACVSDPCASITCNSPPNSCFSSAGTCHNGSCSYPYNTNACNDQSACTTGDTCSAGVCQGVPVSCNNPPANTCENASTVRAYVRAGTCGTGGQCAYTYSFISCASGCNAGACNASGWTKAVSNTTVNLKAVWAASASSAWAGGDQGTLCSWNGTQWQVKNSGVTERIIAIHGTAANSVFALGELGALLHWDGATWTKISGTNNVLWAPATLFSDSANSVWEFGGYVSSANTDALAHYTLSGSSWTGTVTQANNGPFRGGTYPYRIWVESSAAIYLPGGNFWNGTTNSTLGQNVYYSEGPGRMWKSGSVILGLSDEMGGGKTLYQLVSGLWVPMTTGFAGEITDFHGTSATRIFMVGYAYTNGLGHVLYDDGTGWTEQVLPVGTGRLEAVWTLPTGEVFAVGDDGLILKGP